MRPSQSQSAPRAQSGFAAERSAQSAAAERSAQSGFAAERSAQSAFGAELNPFADDAYLRAKRALRASALPRSGSAPEAL